MNRSHVAYPSLLLTSLTVASLCSCQQDSGPGVSATVSAARTSDAAKVRLLATPIACDAAAAGDEVLQELAGSNVAAVVAKLDDDASDDSFRSGLARLDLSAGCYTVSAEPLRSDEGQSGRCSASANVVVKITNDSHDLDLRMPCLGDDSFLRSGHSPTQQFCGAYGGGKPKKGEICAVAALNHAPILQDLRFVPSKFASRCEPFQVCVDVLDTDFDPIEVEFTQLGGSASFKQPELKSSTVAPLTGVVTQCFEFAFDSEGERSLMARVYDLFVDVDGTTLDGSGGTPRYIRAEEWLKNSGQLDANSHTEVGLPVYVTGTWAGPPAQRNVEIHQDGRVLGSLTAYTSVFGSPAFYDYKPTSTPSHDGRDKKSYNGQRRPGVPAPVPTNGQSMIFLYRDPVANQLDLMLVHDAARTSKSHAERLAFAGLGAHAALALLDDPNEPSKDHCVNASGNHIACPTPFDNVQMAWQSGARETDGAVITRLDWSPGHCFSLTPLATKQGGTGYPNPQFWLNVDTWVAWSADRLQPISLAFDSTKPVKICAPQTCVAR